MLGRLRFRPVLIENPLDVLELAAEVYNLLLALAQFESKLLFHFGECVWHGPSLRYRYACGNQSEVLFLLRFNSEIALSKAFRCVAFMRCSLAFHRVCCRRIRSRSRKPSPM